MKKVIILLLGVAVSANVIVAQSFIKKVEYNGIYVKKGSNPSYRWTKVLRFYPDSTVIQELLDGHSIDNRRLESIINDKNFPKQKINIYRDKITFLKEPIEKQQLYQIESNGFFRRGKLEIASRLLDQEGKFISILNASQYEFIAASESRKPKLLRKGENHIYKMPNVPAGFVDGIEAEQNFFQSAYFEFLLSKYTLALGKFLIWEYIVEKDGRVSRVRIVSGYSEKAYEYLTFAMENCSKLYPAIHGGRKVRSSVPRMMIFE
ncbi:MAG: hypothetical protein AAF960_18090 [Bacteroidota bacterium]